MQNQTYKEDGGTTFGTWQDPVSQLMYDAIMPIALTQTNTAGTVADYGGANGLIKKWIPHAITIDIDATKKPDIVDNILTHPETYNLVLLRYVLHYLTDNEITTMLANIKRNCCIIQFTNENEDLKIKNQISQGNEATKYFRTTTQLMQLLQDHNIQNHTTITYKVTPDFYQNRLGIQTTLHHNETINIINLSKGTP